MPRRRISKESVERILQAFREAPGNFHFVATASGVSRPTVRKYWHDGMSCAEEQYWRRPFKDIIAEEQVEARARMETEQKEAAAIAIRNEAERQTRVKAQAAKDATDERTQEAAIVRAARQSVMVQLSNVTQIGAGFVPLAKKAREALEHLSAHMDEQMTMPQIESLTRMINRLATSTRQLDDAAQKVMEMERLLLGEPGKIIGHLHIDLEPVTVVEAKEKLEAVRRAIGTLEAEDIAVLDDRPHDPSLQ